MWLCRMKSPAYICFLTLKVSSADPPSVLETLHSCLSICLSVCQPVCVCLPAYASALGFAVELTANAVKLGKHVGQSDRERV